MTAVHSCGWRCDYGICPRCHRGHGFVILRKPGRSKINSQHSPIPNPTPAMPRPVNTTLGQALVAQITEARETVAYYTRLKTIALNPIARAEAGARVLVWKSNLTALESKLAAENAARAAGTAADPIPNIGLPYSR